MKIKDSLDLNGWVLSNFCIQSDSDLDTYKGKGRKLLFSGNATDEKNNREIIMGLDDKWRVAAYLDDIKAINERLDLLTGEVDLDGVIENMNEVIKFLEDNKDTENLMDLLNSKLDKSGGTIEGTSIQPLLIKSGNESSSAIKFITSDNNSITFGYKKGSGLFCTNENGWSQEYTLLHSGNIGEYALKLDGSNIAPTTINANNNLNDYRYGYVTYKDAKNPTNSYGENAVVMALAGAKDDVTFQLAFDGNNDRLGYRRKSIQNTWSNWKAIAFTDQVLLLDGSNGIANGKSINFYKADGVTPVSGMMMSASNNLLIGYGMLASGVTAVYGNSVQLNYGDSGKAGLILNSSGNVTIGASDLASTTSKLFVDGGVVIKGFDSTQGELGKRISNSLLIGHENYGLQLWSSTSGKVYGQVGYVNGTATAFSLILQHLGGNVGIGTTSPTSKLHIVGDLYVEGNIVATKEVSAGGAAEESGEGGGGTGGGVEPYVFTFTPSTTTVSVNHNISSEDVIVQVFEKDSTSGKWNVILVDIEIVDSTRVDLHFGRTETTEHKVVIIG